MNEHDIPLLIEDEITGYVTCSNRF